MTFTGGDGPCECDGGEHAGHAVPGFLEFGKRGFRFLADEVEADPHYWQEGLRRSQPRDFLDPGRGRFEVAALHRRAELAHGIDRTLAVALALVQGAPHFFGVRFFRQQGLDESGGEFVRIGVQQQLAVAHHEGVGNSADARGAEPVFFEGGAATGEGDRICHAIALAGDELPDLPDIILPHIHPDDPQAAVVVLAVEFVDVRDGGQAGAAPGRPAFEHIDLARFEGLEWLALDPVGGGQSVRLDRGVRLECGFCGFLGQGGGGQEGEQAGGSDGFHGGLASMRRKRPGSASSAGGMVTVMVSTGSPLLDDSLAGVKSVQPVSVVDDWQV